MKPHTKLGTRLLLHQFCMTLLSERGESNKTNANEVSYEASYEAPLTRKTRIEKSCVLEMKSLLDYVFMEKVITFHLRDV